MRSFSVLSLLSLFVLLLACCHVEAKQPDYLILGGGGAAMVIARRLAEDPSRPNVLVLEQGLGADAAVDSDLNTHSGFVDQPKEVHYHAVAQEFAYNRKVYFPTFEGVGGSTRIYGATAARASKAYFDQRMPTGYKYADMLPRMKTNEDHYCNHLPFSYTGITAADCQTYHGQGGPMSIGAQYTPSVTQPVKDLLASARLVLGSTDDYNGNPTARVGAGFEQNFKRLANPNDPSSTPTKIGTWQGFTTPSFLASHPNLEIRLDSKVVRLIFDRHDPTRVIGAQYLADNGTRLAVAFASREVFVCMGVIGTPKFLQSQGIGPSDLLKRIGVPVRVDNHAVGANLTGHQGFLTAYKLNTSLPHDPRYWSNNVLDFFFKTPFTSLDQDIQVSVLEGVYGQDFAPEDGTPPEDLIETIYSAEEHGDFNTILTGAYQRYIGLVIFNTDPTPVGWVNATSADVSKHPLVDYGWSEAGITGTTDISKLFTSLSVTRNIMLNTPFAAKYNVTEIVPDDHFKRLAAKFWPERTGGALQQKADEIFLRYQLTHQFHLTGSCRLGECVDLDGRVKGAKRLRVCDNSLLPQPNANPTTTMMAVCSEIAHRTLASVASCPPQDDHFNDWDNDNDDDDDDNGHDHHK